MKSRKRVNMGSIHVDIKAIEHLQKEEEDTIIKKHSVYNKEKIYRIMWTEIKTFGNIKKLSIG